MSSLSHSPYMETIMYWRDQESIKDCRLRFLGTKMIEMYSFKRNAIQLPSNQEAFADYVEFAPARNNGISETSKMGVVIPCYCGSEQSRRQIERLTICLAEQTEKSAAIIFIDDCSPISYSINGCPNAVLLRLPKNKGPAAARLLGLKQAIKAGCEVIAFTDSDCVPSKDWLSAIRATFLNDRLCSIVSGKTVSYGKTWFDRYHERNGTLNGRRFKGMNFLLYGPTCNLAITADVGKEVSFDEDFPHAAGEDINFCLQANRLGFRIKYNPSMIIQHDFGYTGAFFSDLKRFRRQFERYADGEKVLIRKNPSYYIYFEQTREISAC